jgi:hypothetical protein
VTAIFRKWLTPVRTTNYGFGILRARYSACSRLILSPLHFAPFRTGLGIRGMPLCKATNRRASPIRLFPTDSVFRSDAVKKAATRQDPRPASSGSQPSPGRPSSRVSARRTDTIVVRTRETIKSALLIQKGALPNSVVRLGLKARSQPPSSGPAKRPRLAQACMRPRIRPCQYLFTERETNPLIVGLTDGAQQ